MFGIVALRQMKRMGSGAKITLSSHTVPRSRSLMKWNSSKIAKSTCASRSGSSSRVLRKISVVMMRAGAP